MSWPKRTWICMDKYFMRLAIREAEKSRGLCSPNPFVGAVIVKDGKVIAKGRTQAYGFDHAEPDALKKAGKLAKGSTMYVTLEPCCHQGKTPPCTAAIIKAGISRVVAGIADPNPLVSGKGFEILQKAGIEVISGIEADQISKQNEAFICNIVKKRPFVTWKCALSLDGKYAAMDGSSQWISNELSRKMVHRMRANSDVVLAGINSVIKDDAMLNARGVKVSKKALRVVLDPFLDLSPSSRFAQIAVHAPALVFHCTANEEKEARLHAMGIQTSLVPGNADELDLNHVLSELHLRKVSSVFLETGNRLSEAFWRAGLVDKCVIFYGNMVLGGANSCLHGLNLPSISDAITLERVKLTKLGQNIMLTAYPLS